MASRSSPSFAAVLFALHAATAGAARIRPGAMELAPEQPAGLDGSSLLQRDLSDLHASFYAHYELDKGALWNAQNAFRHFAERAQLLAKETGPQDQHFVPSQSLDANADAAFKKDEPQVMGRESLTAEELAEYEARVVEELKVAAYHDKLKDIKNETKRDQVWAQEVGTALQDQKPVTSENLVAQINSLDIGWKAAPVDGVKHMSMHDAKSLNGVIKDLTQQDDIAKVWKLYQQGAQMNASSLAELLAGNGSALPDSFDSVSKWPACKKVIDHVRNQGTCGSCWAHSSTYVLETRLCIDTAGKFSGDNFWISSLHATSCSKPGQMVNKVIKPGDGCQGGSFRYTFNYAQRSGIVTGSSAPTEANTCLPYAIGGDSLQHFKPNVQPKAPPCQVACTNGKYTRPLAQDVYKLAFSYTGTKDHAQARLAIYTSGPIIFDYAVYRDFMSYKMGVYIPTTLDKGSLSGYHSTSCIGFGKDAKAGDFLFCRNSWGRNWGDNGSFKIKPDTGVLLEYGIAGPIDATKSTLPSSA